MSDQPYPSCVQHLQLKSWSEFVDHVERLPPELSVESLWRGQPKSTDHLIATRYRNRGTPLGPDELLSDDRDTRQHLEAFKAALRSSLDLPRSKDSDRWWAVARHAGLKSPLLDWTLSPYIAAYFAFREHEHGAFGECAIFRLNWPIAERVSSLLLGKNAGNRYQDCLVFIAPKGLDNPPMLAQRGMFTWLYPPQVDIAEWAAIHCPTPQEVGPQLTDSLLSVYTLPAGHADLAKNSLNRMNIHAASLFPDLRGSAEYANDMMENIFRADLMRILRGERTPQ